MKEATLRMREQFLATAMAAAGDLAAEEGLPADMAAGEQRTAEWHALRDSRLTASAFSNALGCAPLLKKKMLFRAFRPTKICEFRV